MLRLGVGRVAATAFVGLVMAPMLADSPGALAQAPGDLWQVTTKMSMPGMPMNMPPQTSQSCSTKEWTTPPGGTRDGCTNSEFVVHGATATWNVMCTGQQSMTGHGEVTRSGDAFKGTIKFMGDGFAMTIDLEGKRVGDCTPK
jgi:hypothetical protein